MTNLYFLKKDSNADWVLVDKQEWIRTERTAGFQPKLASDHPDYMKVCATGGFMSSSGILGKIENKVMPEVLNMKKVGMLPNAVYIGRPSAYGNPYIIGKDGTRDEVIEKYRNYLMNNTYLLEKAKKELKGKDLLCYCAPEACHGDILVEIVNEK